MGDQKAVVVGLSGCSSSGKTTLARLLRDIFPNTFILHEDDFYRPEEELPFKGGVRDWDCAESINISDLEKALSHIRTEGTFPPFVDSKEDKNSVGQCPASPAKIEAMRSKVQAWLRPGSPGHDVFSPADDDDDDDDDDDSNNKKRNTSNAPPRVCLLDGFLLYSPPKFSGVMGLIDVRLFLQVSHARAARRRAARDGYVTLEGFWKDPPGYVDSVVWPNYAEAHRWMFVGGDVEGGRLDWDVLRGNGILAQQQQQQQHQQQNVEAGEGVAVDFEFEDTFEWVVDSVMGALEVWHAQRGT